MDPAPDPLETALHHLHTARTTIAAIPDPITRYRAARRLTAELQGPQVAAMAAIARDVVHAHYDSGHTWEETARHFGFDNRQSAQRFATGNTESAKDRRRRTATSPSPTTKD